MVVFFPKEQYNYMIYSTYRKNPEKRVLHNMTFLLPRPDWYRNVILGQNSRQQHHNEHYT